MFWAEVTHKLPLGLGQPPPRAAWFTCPLCSSDASGVHESGEMELSGHSHFAPRVSGWPETPCDHTACLASLTGVPTRASVTLIQSCQGFTV